MMRSVILTPVLLFLVANIILSCDNFISYANANDSARTENPRYSFVAGPKMVVPQNSDGITTAPLSSVSPSPSNNGQNLVTPQGSLSNPVTSNAVTCNTASQAKLTISKIVQDQTASGIDLNSLLFSITLQDNGTPQEFQLAGPTSSQSFCINAGHSFTVTEATNTPVGITFSQQLSGTCNGTIVANQDVTCNITNTITSVQNNNLIVPGTTPPAESNGVQNKKLVTPEGSLSQPAGPVGGEATAIPTDRQTDPPFQTCTGNTVTGTGTAITGGGSIGDVIIKTPSEAKYIIQGNVDMSKVKEALTELKTKTISIAILSDLQPEDGLSLALANPQFNGKIIVGDSTAAKQRVISFNLQDLRTECQFITLAKAIGPATNGNVAPIGQLNKLTPGNVQASDINKLLVGGQTLSTGTKGPFPPALNPPWATCQVSAATPPAPDKNADNLAVYIIKGEVDQSDVSGNTLSVQVSVDLQPTDSDLAKITNNNNIFSKVNLIANENKPTSHNVAFTLDGLFTDCKKVNLATQTIFKPAPNELNP